MVRHPILRRPSLFPHFSLTTTFLWLAWMLSGIGPMDSMMSVMASSASSLELNTLLSNESNALLTLALHLSMRPLANLAILAIPHRLRLSVSVDLINSCIVYRHPFEGGLPHLFLDVIDCLFYKFIRVVLRNLQKESEVLLIKSPMRF